MKYAVVFHKTGTGYSAEVPDLPGCIATGKTLEATRKRIASAIEFHLEGMRLHGEAIPAPATHVEEVAVRAA